MCAQGVSPAARGGSVSEEVQIKCPHLDRNEGSGSRSLAAPRLSGLQLKPRLNRCASIKHQSITGSGLLPPGDSALATVPEDQPPEEMTESREKQVLGWEVGPQRWQHRAAPRPRGRGHPPHALGSDVGGLWVIGSARFFLGKPWFVLTASLLRLTRVQTPALPSCGLGDLFKSHDPRGASISPFIPWRSDPSQAQGKG